METLHQIISLSQSVRSKMFMFFYRILMAIIMTNFSMNKLGFEYSGADFNFKNTFCFLTSNEFLMVVGLYCFYILLFFWAFRGLVDLSMLKWIFQSYSKEQLIEKLISSEVLERKNDKLVFVNEIKRFFIEGLNDIYIKDKVLGVIHTIIDVLNVLLSTTIVFYSVNNSDKYLSGWIGLLLITLLLIAFFFVYLTILNLTKLIKLPEVIEEINKVEPKNMNQDENKIQSR